MRAVSVCEHFQYMGRTMHLEIVTRTVEVCHSLAVYGHDALQSRVVIIPYLGLVKCDTDVAVLPIGIVFYTHFICFIFGSKRSYSVDFWTYQSCTSTSFRAFYSDLGHK